MIAERRELASLKTTERTTLLSVQVGAIGVEPVNRLRSNLIPINVVGEREIAVRNEVWKNEGSGHLSRCVHVGVRREWKVEKRLPGPSSAVLQEWLGGKLRMV